MTRMPTFLLLVVILVITIFLGAYPYAASAGVNAAVQYLGTVMDQYHQTVDVYTDSNAAGNHFVMRGKISSEGDQDAVENMTEDYGTQPYSGIDCIKAQF